MSGTEHTPRQLARRNAVMLAVAMLGSFAAVRIHLAIAPDADFNVGPYNVHHLFTGLVLITLGGVPLAVLRGSSRWMDAALLPSGSASAWPWTSGSISLSPTAATRRTCCRSRSGAG